MINRLPSSICIAKFDGVNHRIWRIAQHFLLSAAARTLSLASVARMSDEEAERVFIRLRFAANDGNANCPHCRCTTVYMARRPSGAARWRCKACRKDFSVTTGLVAIVT